jgi:hypothetical protein
LLLHQWQSLKVDQIHLPGGPVVEEEIASHVVLGLLDWWAEVV